MKGPVFLVGTSRSGTAVIRSALNAHPDLYLSGESHYFDDLRVRLGGNAAERLDESQRHMCEDYFLAIAHRPYGHGGDPAQSPIPREELGTLAEELGATGDAYFEAYCRLEAKRTGSNRWGEKTPRHIFRLAEMLQAFDGAQAICMVRDPRAVVASYRDWKNQGGFDFEKDPGHREALEQDHLRTRRSYHPIIIAMLWKSAMTAALEAQRRFGESRVRLVRYEDVVRDAESVIRPIAGWLDIEFLPEMLDVPMHNSSYARFDEHGGFSTAPIDRWKEKLSGTEIAAIESACGGMLRRLGYERIAGSLPFIRALSAWISLPAAALRAARANRQRIGNLPAYLWRRTRLMLARP